MSDPYSFMPDLTEDEDWVGACLRADDDCGPAPHSENIFPIQQSSDHPFRAFSPACQEIAGKSVLVHGPSMRLLPGLPTFSDPLEVQEVHKAQEAHFDFERLSHPPADPAIDLVEAPHNDGPPFTNARSPSSLIYLPRECASCDGSLDKSEQDLDFVNPTFYCNRNQERGHLIIACQVPGCLEKFSDLKDLKKHSSKAKHDTLVCGIARCYTALSALPSSILHHLKAHHPYASRYSCAKCGDGFDIESDMIDHCWDSGHSTTVCQFPDCSAECTKLADLERHQLIHKRKKRTYPCTHCRKYRGSNGFKRKDHLVQHMRNYHRPEDGAFTEGYCNLEFPDDICGFKYTTLSALTDHMLEVHYRSAYLCPKPDCDRVGMNGFENKKDLNSHLKKDHISEFQCTHPGCDRVGSNGWKRRRDMVKHIEKVHGSSAMFET